MVTQITLVGNYLARFLAAFMNPSNKGAPAPADPLVLGGTDWQQRTDGFGLYDFY